MIQTTYFKIKDLTLQLYLPIRVAIGNVIMSRQEFWIKVMRLESSPSATLSFKIYYKFFKDFEHHQ